MILQIKTSSQTIEKSGIVFLTNRISKSGLEDLGWGDSQDQVEQIRRN